MSYRETAQALGQIEAGGEASYLTDALRMSPWAEERRDTMSAVTVAWNHVMHVTELASDLREALTAYGDAATVLPVARRALALLEAIGEGGESEAAPRRVKDEDGDTWERGTDGLYRVEGHEDSMALTLDNLRYAFGPLKVVMK